MKRIIFMSILFFTAVSFGQTEITKKVDGNPSNSCIIGSDFKEPKWSSTKIRTRNKTRVGDLKNYISKDMGVDVSKIIMLSFKEQAANGIYVLCVDGNKMKYIRNSAVFRKEGEGVKFNGIN